MSGSFDFASLRSGRTETGVKVRESIPEVSIVQRFLKSFLGGSAIV